MGNEYARVARTNKAIAIESVMRQHGIVRAAQVRALTDAQRLEWVRKAGITSASQDTWNIVMNFYDDYDTAREQARRNG